MSRGRALKRLLFCFEYSFKNYLSRSSLWENILILNKFLLYRSIFDYNYSELHLSCLITFIQLYVFILKKQPNWKTFSWFFTNWSKIYYSRCFSAFVKQFDSQNYRVSRLWQFIKIRRLKFLALLQTVRFYCLKFQRVLWNFNGYC